MNDPVKVPTQAKTAVESSMVRRRCPTCGEVAAIEIVEMADGWEVWLCRASGCRNDYRTT